jgi:CBS domain-containing protein
VKGPSVGDLMTREVVSARESTSFKELVRLLLEHRISGVPVVDADGVLVGIVTEVDLLKVEGDEGGYGGMLEWIVHPKRMADAHGAAEGLTAGDLMTPKVVTVRPEASLHEAAVTLLRADVKRLPVVRAAAVHALR